MRMAVLPALDLAVLGSLDQGPAPLHTLETSVEGLAPGSWELCMADPPR